MKKVRVRIAVAVDQDGEWNAAGWSRRGKSCDDDEMMSVCVEGVGGNEASYFVEAEVYVPERPTVKADKIEVVS